MLEGMAVLRSVAIALTLLFCLPAEASREWEGPISSGPSLVKEGQGRQARKKRRRLRRKRVRPTRFQNITPHQHLGPGLSR